MIEVKGLIYWCLFNYQLNTLNFPVFFFFHLSCYGLYKFSDFVGLSDYISHVHVSKIEAGVVLANLGGAFGN